MIVRLSGLIINIVLRSCLDRFSKHSKQDKRFCSYAAEGAGYHRLPFRYPEGDGHLCSECGDYKLVTDDRLKEACYYRYMKENAYMYMNDYLRESLSYFGLYKKMFQVKKKYKPARVSYGNHKDQYFLYYEPDQIVTDKVIVWVHGGGWNAGSPHFFDYVGQCICDQGYRFISLGYRLSPRYQYPCQIRDVCEAYKAALTYMTARGIDISKIIVTGPSAGAHLTSIMCYCRKVQEKYGVDVSNIIGFIGFGGPYSFRDDQGLMIRLLLNQFFRKGYQRKNGEPLALMGKSHIPMLLIQSKHDGLIDYACAEEFAGRAQEIGNICELYSVTDKKNTHSWYTAGLFLETREDNKTLDKFFSWIEACDA